MPTGNLLVGKNTRLFFAMAWTVIVAILCLISFDSLTSDLKMTHSDKFVHLVFHLVFVILWFFYFKDLLSNTERWNIVAGCIAFSFIYGICIELAQEFSATREADIADIIANLGGACMGAVILIIRKRTLQNPSP